jgi:hypothetical protein
MIISCGFQTSRELFSSHASGQSVAGEARLLNTMSNDAFLKVLRVTFLVGSVTFVILAMVVQERVFVVTGLVAFLVALYLWDKNSAESRASSIDPPSTLPVLALILGYLITIFAALFLLTPVLMFFSMLGIVLGTTVVDVASSRRPSMGRPPMTRRAWIILATGCAVILIAIFAYGNKRLPQWAPNPMSYILAWTVSFQAFRHLSAISRERAPSKHWLRPEQMNAS